MKVKYKIKEVHPQVFCVTFKHQYDLCMTFFRWQEYYESSSKKVRNQNVNFFKIMKDYSKRLGKGNFTYPTDWYGFNLPSWVFEKVDPMKALECKDSTPYDQIMLDIIDEIYFHIENGSKFYLVGIAKNYQDKWEGTKTILKHELSHALYYLNPQYKERADNILKQMPEKKLKQMYKLFKKEGYAKEVFEDERSSLLVYRTT